MNCQRIPAISEDMEFFDFNVRVEGNRIFFDLLERRTDIKLSWEISDPRCAPLFRMIGNRLDEQSGKRKIFIDELTGRKKAIHG